MPPPHRSNCAITGAIFCHQIGQPRAFSHHTVQTKVRRQRATRGTADRIQSWRILLLFCEACEMVSSDGRDHSRRGASSVAKGARKAAARPSPAETFDVDHDEPAIRVARLQVQQQRSQKLHDYYDEALAEIRASLEWAPQR